MDRGIIYDNAAMQTLEERVDKLEKNMVELSTKLNGTLGEKAWLMTVASQSDDEISREADRLGREYRQNPMDSADDVGT